MRSRHLLLGAATILSLAALGAGCSSRSDESAEQTDENGQSLTAADLQELVPSARNAGVPGALHQSSVPGSAGARVFVNTHNGRVDITRIEHSPDDAYGKATTPIHTRFLSVGLANALKGTNVGAKTAGATINIQAAAAQLAPGDDGRLITADFISPKFLNGRDPSVVKEELDRLETADANLVNVSQLKSEGGLSIQAAQGCTMATDGGILLGMAATGVLIKVGVAAIAASSAVGLVTLGAIAGGLVLGGVLLDRLFTDPSSVGNALSTTWSGVKAIVHSVGCAAGVVLKDVGGGISDKLVEWTSSSYTPSSGSSVGNAAAKKACEAKGDVWINAACLQKATPADCDTAFNNLLDGNQPCTVVGDGSTRQCLCAVGNDVWCEGNPAGASSLKDTLSAKACAASEDSASNRGPCICTLADSWYH